MSRSELARQIQYLKAENEVLRSKLPKRITVTPSERQRLLKFGKAVGPAIRHLITIVSHRTFLRWLACGKSPRKPRKRGRPRTADEIRQIILRLAEETGWGYTRILGELRKLGIRSVGRTTVINILKDNGFDPAPKRGEGSWDEFIKIHAKTLWACDFISKKVWTRFGLIDYFILFFIHVDSRRIYVSGISPHPNAAWVAQQARNFSMHVAEQGQEASHLIHDCDTKFTDHFDGILEAEGVDIVKTVPVSPNLNAYAERWCQSLQVECLDNFVVLGEKHLRYLVSEFVTYYNRERPHQSLGNKPLTQTSKDPPSSTGEILCQERLGGLLRHYYRKAG